jgi:hypothetical protein
MAIVIACLAAASEAAAQYCEAERLHYFAEGDGVSADFSSLDTSTCALGIETNVHVDASVGEIHIVDVCGGGATRTRDVTDSVPNIVAVVISVYDRCLGLPVLSVTGSGAAEEIHVNPNRKTASLRAAIEGTDESDQPVSIAIDLVWDGVGRKDHTSGRAVFGHGVFRMNFHSVGTIRDAVAAGSVVLDGTDLTPRLSTQGTIEKDASREIDVYR